MKSILLLALLLVPAASAISVQMGTDQGSVETSMSGDGAFAGTMLATEAGILSQVTGSGDVAIEQAAAGGGRSVQFGAEVVGGGEITSEIGASQGGVFGQLNEGRIDGLSYEEVDTLARNPDLSVVKEAKTRITGSTVRINGGTDATAGCGWIDPNKQFLIGVQNADFVSPRSLNTISHTMTLNAAVSGANFINSAAGLPVIDGVYESGRCTFGALDYKNTIHWSYWESDVDGMSSKWMRSNGEVVDWDAKLNGYYDNIYGTQAPRPQTMITALTTHELFHTSLADWSPARYPGLSASSTVMGSSLTPTSVDRTVLNLVYRC